VCKLVATVALEIVIANRTPDRPKALARVLD